MGIRWLIIGGDNLLWKTDFAKLFLDRFPDLRLVCKKIVKYKNNNNLDIMYLLEKCKIGEHEK